MSLEITIKLDLFERKFILMIADRSNDVQMNLDQLKPQVVKALDDLEKKGCVYTIPIIGTNSKIYKLTSTGITLVDMIKADSND